MRPWRRSEPGWRWRVRMRPADIDFVSKIIEGHENLAVTRTVDEGGGLVDFWAALDQRRDFAALLGAFREQLQMEVIEEGPGEMGIMESYWDGPERRRRAGGDGG